MEAKSLEWKLKKFSLFSFLGSQGLDLFITIPVVTEMGVAAETNLWARFYMTIMVTVMPIWLATVILKLWPVGLGYGIIYQFGHWKSLFVIACVHTTLLSWVYFQIHFR